MTLAPDVAAIVAERRRERHIGVSEAVNGLVREATVAPKQRETFVQKTSDLGLGDVTNIGRVLEKLDDGAIRPW